MSKGLEFHWPIIGHAGVRRFLQTSIVNKSLTHAYLFYGPEKVGKTTTAKVFAQSILCEHYKEYSSLAATLDAKQIDSILPCGQCESCQQFIKGIYADFYLIEREVNEKTGEKKGVIAVGQIRDLQEKLSKRAFLNSYKIVIIKEAETMSKEAGNSLLKTLEEPTSKTILILIATNREMILKTILSRSQSFKFLPITKDAIYNYLVGRGAGRSMALELAGLSQGRPTVALKLMDSVESLEEYKKRNSNWLRLFKKNNVERFKFVEEILKSKPSTDQLIKDLNEFSSLVRDLLLVESQSPNLLSHIYLENDLNVVSKQNLGKNLVQIMKRIEETKNYLKQNINPKLALENLIINI